jgi:hypothetical protein
MNRQARPAASVANDPERPIDFQAGRDSPAQPAVGAIELVVARPLGKIDAVLALETTLWHH